jgi:hypothetical protein
MGIIIAIECAVDRNWGQLWMKVTLCACHLSLQKFFYYPLAFKK